MKENRKHGSEIGSNIMEQYNDLCNDDESSYQEMNGIYFILVPEKKLRKCLLKLLDR